MTQKFVVPREIIADVICALLAKDARKVTYIMDEKTSVKASRILFDGKISKRDSRAEILLTIGRLNHAERMYIRRARKRGDTFRGATIVRMPPAKRR